MLAIVEQSEETVAMVEKRYTVVGMTCSHCVSAVSSEVGQVPDVVHVDVDLDSGLLQVTGTAFTDEQIREAVEEAGYLLADA
jgi:copper chaperone